VCPEVVLRRVGAGDERIFKTDRSEKVVSVERAFEETGGASVGEAREN